MHKKNKINKKGNKKKKKHFLTFGGKFVKRRGQRICILTNLHALSDESKLYRIKTERVVIIS